MKRGYTVEHEAMWQRPAKCKKVNFFYVELPWSSYWEYQGCICWSFLLMLPVIAKHPPLISFVFHSFWVEGISCLHSRFFSDSLFSLSIWLSLVHFLLRLPAPDPVGSASAGSRQVEIRGGGVEPLMCYQWQVSVTRPEDCQYLLYVFFLYLPMFYSFLINANIRWSLRLENV